ncbi:reverse transcriptase domain-containing protein [Tanacetum coccineum]
MSYFSGTESRLRPYHFNYPERSLTMEEMLNKFIDEGKQEHEEMRAFIYDFQTNNELLFKERNNSPFELRFGVQELLNVINNVPMIDCDVKGVTTRGGKATTLDVRDNDTSVPPKELVVVELEKPARSNKDLTNDQPQITSKPVVQPSNEVQPPPVPFLKRLRKEKREAHKIIFGNLKHTPHKFAFHRSISSNSELLSKEKDPGSFTIPCDIGQLHIDNALADLEASISLMPYTMYKKLGSGEPKATKMTLKLADRSIQYPRGIIENVLIKVDKFVLPIDFVILDMPEDSRFPIILGRPLLATARAMIDVFNKKITLRVGDDEVVFDVDQSIKRPTTEDDECYGIDDLDEMINKEAQELQTNEEPDSFLSRGLEKSIDQSDLECCESTSKNEKNGSDLENSIRRINSVNTPYPVTQGITNGNNVKSEHLYSASANEIDEKKPEMKNFPQQLEYAYLNGDKSFPIIISSELSEKEKTSLLRVLEKRKGAIAWKISDIKGINSSYVSSIHVVPKKGGMTVVLNDNNQLIPSRTVTGWRVCIDYRKLNDATRKDHFPLPFIDQMLEHLCGNEYCCFLDGFSGFFQIPIALEDQENTTFTCPYGTFAYRRMSFGLCNAPATFQRCMMAIFHDMVEDFMEVFMDDFSVFGFEIEIKDKKGAENLAADHLSRLENPDLGTFVEEEITDEFPDEHLIILKAELNNDEPWYADYINYILCSDNVMRRCVAGNEIFEIMAYCHSRPTGGHHSASITGRKVYESGFYWPSIFKDAKDYVMKCDARHRSGNISSRSEMPQN